MQKTEVPGREAKGEHPGINSRVQGASKGISTAGYQVEGEQEPGYQAVLVEMVGQAATLQLNKHELPKFEIQSKLLHSVQNDPRQKNTRAGVPAAAKQKARVKRGTDYV